MALALVIVIALLCSLAAYVLLMAAVTEVRRAKYFRERTRARYLAEAALVIAMEKLWGNPTYCGGTEFVDTDGNGLGETPVVVTASGSCAAGGSRRLQAKVLY